MIIGQIDRCTEREIEGWAFNPEQGCVPMIRINVNDVTVGELLPDRNRSDVNGLGIEASVGFYFMFMFPIGFGSRIEVTTPDGDHLTGSPLLLGQEHLIDFFQGRRDKRRALSYAFLRGSGLEIGALNHPLSVAPGVRVRYVDRMDTDALREQYPELENADLVTPDIIDNGETLSRVPDGSLDFVAANHFLEHTEDPIGCLKTFSRVLKPNGRLFLAIPDKTRTFDRHRNITSIEHFEQDHLDGGKRSRNQHFLQWAAHINHKKGKGIRHQAEVLNRSDYSIHFHVWTFESFMMFLCHVIQQHIPSFKILLGILNDPDEMLFILEKNKERVWLAH